MLKRLAIAVAAVGLLVAGCTGDGDTPSQEQTTEVEVGPDTGPDRTEVPSLNEGLHQSAENMQTALEQVEEDGCAQNPSADEACVETLQRFSDSLEVVVFEIRAVSDMTELMNVLSAGIVLSSALDDWVVAYEAA